MVAEITTNTAQNEGGIIIVGGGLAGLFCALKLAPLPVTILAAAPIGTGASSAWAQGGIAAAMSPGDSAAKHVADTLTAGAGIVDEEIALLMAREASDRIHDLLEYGVPFDKDLEGALKLSREAAHSERRIVRVRGDMAGKAIMTALIAAVERSPSIKILPGFVAEEIKKDPETGVVSGVVARGQSGAAEQAYLFPTRALILASGGSGHLYQVTTNPAESRGGGMAMAARAGAMIADAEFVQFHPTAINVDKDPAPLATEALRGDGATLWNGNNERFMMDIHEDAELAPRDIVARGIFNEVQAGRGAFLDCTEAVGKHFPDEFPTVYGYCEQAGIDPVTERIPVIPAAHYHMGGVSVDANGRTSLSNLWACGEAASTGAHGANRLASNSLLEAVVFAHRIAMDIKETISVVQRQDFSALNGETVGEMEISDPAAYNLLRKTMSDCVGVVRTETGLRHALAVIQALENKANAPRFQNMIVAAKLIAASAFLRQESRGGHFRSDYPEAVEALAERSLITEKQATRVMQREARFDKSWLEKMQPEKTKQEA